MEPSPNKSHRTKRADYTFAGDTIAQKWRHSPMVNVFCVEADADLLRWLAAEFEERAREVEARKQ